MIDFVTVRTGPNVLVGLGVASLSAGRARVNYDAYWHFFPNLM
jgi:hypothetical protein